MNDSTFPAIFVAIAIAVGVLVFALMVQQNDACREKGGSPIRTSAGFICLDAREIRS